MALTKNRELNRYVDQELRAYGVASGALIFKGAFVGVERSSGFVRNLAPGDLFAGIAYEEVDNTGGAAGAMTIRVYTEGDFVLPISAMGQTLVGASVYAVDNETITAAPVAGASMVGVFLAPISSSIGIIRILPAGAQLVELAVHLPIVSSTTVANTHVMLIPQRPIRIISAQVAFRIVPDQGLLDIGTTPADPDQMVDAFSLNTLSANTPALLPLVSRTFAAGAPIYAKVGQATTTAGQNGMVSIRYVELP